MVANVSFSKKGRAINVTSFKVACRRSIPDKCFHCGEIMCEVDNDEICNYEVLIYECRNGHTREVLIEKEEI